MMRPTALASAFALALLVPTASAVDLLATDVQLGEHEARFLVRSTAARIDVTTDPPVLVGAARPGGEPEPLAPAPRSLEPRFVWRGIEGVIEIALRRDDPGAAVDVFLEDDTRAGLWLEWPAHEGGRGVPMASVLLAALLAALARRRAE